MNISDGEPAAGLEKRREDQSVARSLFLLQNALQYVCLQRIMAAQRGVAAADHLKRKAFCGLQTSFRDLAVNGLCFFFLQAS